ncbi:MAG: glycoside hydrolase [Chitinophagaceae bacterium]|nr:glycoside hydrolase [Chitinophagaceae bacterium]
MPFNFLLPTSAATICYTPLSRFAIIGFGIIWLSIIAGSASLMAQKYSYRASRQAVPVLSGMATNPVIKVELQKGNLSINRAEKIRLELSATALLWCAGIQVFQTPDSVFSTLFPCGTMVPVHKKPEIPLTIAPDSRSSCLWISFLPKPGMPAGLQLSIQATHLTEKGGKNYKIEQETKNQGFFTGNVVQKGGSNGVHTFRIPGLTTTKHGTLVAVYDVRHTNSGDLPGNIDVGMSRSTDGGNTWQPMQLIMDMGAPHENNGVGDPAILYDSSTHTLWVAALWSKGNRSIAGSRPGLSPDTTGQLVIVKSTDDGQTWSKPVSITPGVKKPGWHLLFNGPGAGIVMQNGTLVFAAQYWDENRIPHATLLYSQNKGAKWEPCPIGPLANTTEAQVAETSPGTLMLSMRDNRGGYRSIATTNNMGASWQLHPTSGNTLTDPVCMASLLHIAGKSGQQSALWFSNPADTRRRLNLTLKASTDGGNSWPAGMQKIIDQREGYGYSCLTQADDKHIGMLYEGKGDLYFVKIPLKSILKP